jgi:hypothetical protein
MVDSGPIPPIIPNVFIFIPRSLTPFEDSIPGQSDAISSEAMTGSKVNLPVRSLLK